MGVIRCNGHEWTGTSVEFDGVNIIVDGKIVYTFKEKHGEAIVDVEGRCKHVEATNCLSVRGGVGSLKASNTAFVSGRVSGDMCSAYQLTCRRVRCSK